MAALSDREQASAGAQAEAERMRMRVMEPGPPASHSTLEEMQVDWMPWPPAGQALLMK
jgi:hypothetical protein